MEKSVEALPGVLGNRGTRAFISGEQGNKGQILRGTGEQRQYWGTGNIRKQIFNFWGTGEQANSFQGNRYPPPPPGRASVFIGVIFRSVVENFSTITKCYGYSKEPSQWDGSFKHPRIFTFLHYLDLSLQAHNLQTTLYDVAWMLIHVCCLTLCACWDALRTICGICRTA